MKKYIYLGALLLTISLTLTACTTKDDKNLGEEINTDENESTIIAESEDESLNGNIFDLLKLNKSVKCTFKSETDEGTTSGITYVANGKTKTEFEVKTDDMDMKSYSISDGEWIFTWTSENNQGTKLNLKDMEKYDEDPVDNEEPEEVDYSDQTQDFDYKCTPWAVDNSVFDLPKNIEFTNLNEMMEDFMQLQDSIPTME